MLRYLGFTILTIGAAALVAPRQQPPAPAPLIVTEPTPAVGQPQPVAAGAPASNAVDPSQANKEGPPAPDAPFGYCPKCYTEGVALTAGGKVACGNGHTFTLAEAVAGPPVKGAAPGRTKACECVNCTCDPCVCGPSKGFRPGIPSDEPERFDYEPQVPHYRSTTAGWVPCKMLTASEARELNATIMKAQQPAARSAPVRVQVAPPVTMFQPFTSGGCANGQCGTSGGFFRRGRR